MASQPPQPGLSIMAGLISISHRRREDAQARSVREGKGKGSLLKTAGQPGDIVMQKVGYPGSQLGIPSATLMASAEESGLGSRPDSI
jgi:hypothetical protein